MVLPAVPRPDEVADIGSAAHALAYVVIAARRHTDIFEWGQRSTPFALAAEIQRRLLPASYTCEAGQFTLAGWLEPAAAVGGDTFDYTLDRRLPCRCRSPTPSATRSPPRCWRPCWSAACATAAAKGLDLAAQARYANDALAENAPPGQFVTGQLLRVDLHTGTARRSSTPGIPPAPAARRPGGGGPAARSSRRSASSRAGRSTCSAFPLEPGDRIVLLTDGMQERNAVDLDVATALADTAALHPREVVHALGAAVLDATGGDLRDDATVVCLDWYGGPPRGRTTEQGADPGPRLGGC